MLMHKKEFDFAARKFSHNKRYPKELQKFSQIKQEFLSCK